MARALAESVVEVPLGPLVLQGDWRVPASPIGAVLFAHGSGSSRHSPRNQFVASVLHRHHIATLLMDLLTAEEERRDEVSGAWRFDVKSLAGRLVGATDWLAGQPDIGGLSLGYFGASTGAAAALLAASERPQMVRAVVSRGGRVDMAEEALPFVSASTLFIVGELDEPVLQWNKEAFQKLGAPQKKLVIIPGATHLFEEPGALEKVADLAAAWFRRNMPS